jgi:hypothetical protein
LVTELDTLRLEKDAFFASDPQSPLTLEQKRTFVRLTYFPENTDLRLELAAEGDLRKERIDMQTSTGDVQAYERHCRLHFLVDGVRSELTIFEGPNGFFLPFIDSLAGIHSYPAGRYLEPEQLPGGRFLVDFNLAYNPYCAYNERWSCPITPSENRLVVPIRAGEKLFRSHQ